MAEGTPMMIQYHKIKDKLPDCILFFRLGDFYEMFNEDAVIAARELDLALTTRDRSRPPEEQTPMCGVPYHAYESYVARLLSKGYKVAVCEQLEDPALARGLVDRDVIRIITPGTVIEHSMLEENRPNYISSVFLSDDAGAVCFADISTGEFLAAEFQGRDCSGHIANELVRYSPSEVLLSDPAAADPGISLLLRERMNCMCHGGQGYFEQSAGGEYFKEHFSSLDPASVSPGVVSAAGALLSYLHETQKTSLGHIDALTLYSSGRYMELDWQTRRNLELTETMRSQDKKGSLLWVLDKTRTSMGGRLLRSMIEKPLLSPAVIKQRLNAVAELADGTVLRGELRDALKNIDDVERLTGRIVYGNSNARDLAALASSAAELPRIKALLAPVKCALLQKTAAFDELAEVRTLIEAAIGDDPPFSVREGGMVRPGYSDEVDRLRGLTENARGAVASIESAERERTGIKKLRIGYNKVFGYYIEIPRSQSEAVPDNYIRRQTLVNCERFITEELKDLESQLLTAHDRLTQLEYQIFKELTDAVSAMASVIRQTAADIALLDALCSLAETAVKNGYCMPEVDVSGVIDIREGRHPVVERAQRDTLFVPNDTVMDAGENRVAIITGPNMAGKSTYMRQTALIVLMAQIGSFVPARSARIGIADRIFTRIGASDDLAAGQSTFMVEMTEVASILKNAGPNSLLILDEIGRGTSTYDGMAIARAVVEYCADPKKLGARTMFATHYHELTRLEDTLSCVKNLSTAVKKRGDDVIFLRRIVHGGADRSYGIEVAKLAGVPDSVIRRAKDVLSELEKGGAPAPDAPAPAGDDGQLSLSSLADSAAAARIRACEPETLTPIEAMNLLFELKKMLQ
ncbi:MAG: DNA mismatch repair protein MutS [Oscillospiraceae bacterium]|nr:DNA mismatch repair protein MutS [Oscillospiraceae bacterium]